MGSTMDQFRSTVKVAYKRPCDCGDMYMGKTGRKIALDEAREEYSDIVHDGDFRQEDKF